LPKLGKKDLFTPTLERTVSPLRPGAALSEGEAEKVMVMLIPHQVHELDKVCLQIRQTTGIKVKRSMLIRALIDGFLGTPVNYKDARSLADLSQKIIHSFNPRP
jgi:hypothetical protein